ncbi:hypothetical protein AB1L30_08990 [Bremerella sp. JC817]|uniref:hypothetical protein n=1 Tax=Bremerella sp. JC817 TaxID=3231756 RepID=UPI00345AE8E5
MKTATLPTAVLAVWSSLVCVSNAADFQVATSIYRGNERSPVATYQTVFKGDKIYDVVMTPPRQVTIIDFSNGQITMLDPGQGQDTAVRTTMSTQDVLQHATYFKQYGDLPSNPLWDFLKNPSFQTSYDPGTQVLKLSGDPLIYEADLQKIEDQPLADAYSQFCDWSAMLNFISMGSDLPQARMSLNAEVKSRGAVPTEVRKTIRNADPSKIVSLKSRHEYRWTLNVSDDKLIQSIEADLAKAKPVKFDAYIKRTSAAQK